MGETELPLEELRQMMQAGNVINTRPMWDDVFHSLRYTTVLTNDQKRHFNVIFRRMAGSLMHTNAFLRALKASMLARPRVTRRFLRQVLPPQFFPRSLHAYSGWEIIAIIRDYLRYLLFGPPTQRFEEQLAQYVKRLQQEQNATTRRTHQVQERRSTKQTQKKPTQQQQQYYSAQEFPSQQQARSVRSSGSWKQVPQQQKYYSSIIRNINNILFGEHKKSQQQQQQQQQTNIYFRSLQQADKIGDETVYGEAIIPIKAEMTRVFGDQCPEQQQRELVGIIIDYLCNNGLRMTYKDFGRVYLELEKMEGCEQVRDALFAITRLIFMEVLRRKEEERDVRANKKDVKEILDYMSKFHNRYLTANYLFFRKYDAVVKVLEIMGYSMPKLTWSKRYKRVRRALENK